MGKFKPVFGRLLNKQKRGPRILQLKEYLLKKGFQYFQGSNLETMECFLLSQHVQRAEIDNLIQGFKIKTKLKLSLYYPYVYISTTRLCMLNGINNLARTRLEIKPCQKECQKNIFYNDQFPLQLILKGNTQFYFNDKLPEKNYDRLVFSPEIIL